MTKEEIRIRQKELRKKLSAREREQLDLQIRERLIGTDAYQKCKDLFTFVSFGTEADTREIILQALRDGKRVYAPRVEGKNMEFYEIHNLTGLIPSGYGVPEPPGEDRSRFIYDNIVPFEGILNPGGQLYTENQLNNTCTIQNYCKPADISMIYDKLMLLPGLAFDLYGNRIGYGAGYYDKYLSSHPEINFYKTALAYDFQVMDSITTEKFDIKADAVLTPTQFILCR